MKVASVLAVVLLACCQPLVFSQGRPPGGDPAIGDRIAQAIAFDGKLWLRGTLLNRGDDSGGLISFDLASNARRAHYDQGVLDVTKSKRDLWILRKGAKDREFLVSAWRGTGFEDIAGFQSSESDMPIVLLPNSDLPIVLGSKTVRVLGPTNNALRVVELKGKLRGGVQVSAAVAEEGGILYVGFNEGEWGGGLQRIDLSTGLVLNVERRDSKALCEGPLNSDCDPVTGVIQDPQHKNCVLASVGLLHMSLANGRILRVCGDQVSLVSELLLSPPEERWKRTEPIYGLAAAAHGFWGITSKRLYHYNPDGTIERYYLFPKLKAISGIHMSREVPGTIVLMTDVNWAVSTSGYTPLIVALDNK